MNESEITTLAKAGYFNGDLLEGTVEETHISWIILTKRFVFKIKKPVKLSFLDFSTKTKRKRFCEREVILNRRLSKIYLDVVPIYNHANSWHIGENKGFVKEYAVRMKRLRSDRKMDNMLKRKQVKKENILSLAKAVASFHKKADTVTNAFEISEAGNLFNDILSVRKFVRGQLGNDYSTIVTRAIRWSYKFLRTYASRLQERVVTGFKRDLHGDLHSGNIFLYKTPVIFDCIEFNDSYRQIDVINEIAFFCMDLEANKKKSFSRLFLAEYRRHFSCFQTKEDERLFLYFKCYRANVRAKVNAISAQQNPNNPEYLRDVKTYLQLMKSYIDNLGTQA
jgi:aminoglycoside phosphotransferase family enzyme